jgi:serine/threonine-protein kinase
MAPEQAKGQPVDGRADQYSLGVVGYRLLAGVLPFSGDSVHTILYKHIFEEAPRVSALRTTASKDLTDAIQRALSKDPAQRFATMEEFATALWPEQPVSATGKTPRPVPRPGARGPVTADTPTEHVAASAGAGAAPATAAAPARARTIPAAAMRTAPKKSSKAGVFLVLLLLAAAGGGYVVLRGRGSGEVPSAQPAGTTSPVEQQPAAAQTPPAVAVTPGSTAVTNPAPVTQAPPPAATPPTTPTRQTNRPTGQNRPPARQQAPVVQQPPPVVQPPAEEVGYLSIDAVPFGTVSIDGVQVGDTPLDRYKLKPGMHTIRIESPGYKTKTERVQIDAGNTVRRRITLEAEG